MFEGLETGSHDVSVAVSPGSGSQTQHRAVGQELQLFCSGQRKVIANAGICIYSEFRLSPPSR